ncbi:MAG: hypothetical protein WCY26_06190 [Thiohalobacteraceae bacterium]|nr:hypothetical protein [Ottowia sp.]
MVALIPPQTVLTSTDAANQLQANTLDALGLTAPNLSSGWADATPTASDYAAASLQLTLSNPRAPFRAPLRIEQTPTVWSDLNGDPVGGPVAVLALHPEAAHRLAKLVEVRLGAPLIRPLPVAMLVHGVSAPATPQPINWFRAGEALGFAGAHAVSFHDARGLPIDPLAMAALFLDLLTWRPALRIGDPAMPAVGAAGGLNGILALVTSSIRCHVIDPHGRGYVPNRDAARLKVIDAGNAEVSAVADSGLITLAANQRIGRSSADDSAENTALAGTQRRPPLQWGWAHQAVLARTALVPPPLPGGVTLATQFFRVVAVDLDWHLLGNRTAATVNEVPGDDDTVPDFALPIVRTAVPNFDYLVDAMDVLGAANQIAAGFPPSGADVLALLASPAIDTTLALPPGPGAAGHWPAFPSPNPGGRLTASADATQGLIAAFRAPADGANAKLDVIVTIAADAVPAGTHLRIFPRRFMEIDAIGEQPSFVRADGGASIAVAGQPTPVLLVNPFALQGTDPLPVAARLTVDVVAVGRNGQRRLHSAVDLDVSTTTASWTDHSARFGGTALLNVPTVTALMSAFGATAVAPASLFGIPPGVPPAGGTPTGILGLVRRLANETTAPRQGPHLPTQGRFDTVWAVGATPASGQPLAWKAVLSGARWTPESRSAQPELGDPGNPAGPDVHAAGVRVEGQLGYDLAFHALKRTQPIIPMSAGTPGWLMTTGGDNWNDPAPDTTGTVAAAMLETIAPFCDTPELGISAIPVPQPGDTIQNGINALADLLGVPHVTFSTANEDRLRRELQREMITAKHGQRDALWALARAFTEAREFVYIESPAFARTARPTGAAKPHEIDLVEVLRARMAANPRLKVMLCVPREPDMDPAKANWVRAALAERKQAINTLTAQDRQRVAAFQPIGFPGRATSIRSTVVIVDDVWTLVGTSHMRRRGMTFDGGADVVSIDRSFGARGTSAGIARFRQELMAAKLGVNVPAGPGNSTALWTRLAEPESAFAVLAELLASGGLGRCAPVWAGPTDNKVIPQTDAIADPDGVDPDGNGLLGLFGALVLDA